MGGCASVCKTVSAKRNRFCICRACRSVKWRECAYRHEVGIVSTFVELRRFEATSESRLPFNVATVGAAELVRVSYSEIP